jgi:hypothetical protein
MPKTLPGAPAGLNETQPSPPSPNAEQPLLNGEQRFQQTQTRAYQLWEEAGKPAGDAERERFWREAETQLDGHSNQPTSII